MATSSPVLWITQTERGSRGWRGHVELAKEDIAAGADGVLVTERNFTGEELTEEALKVKAVCDAAQAILLVRDNVMAAFVSGATGVVVSLAGVAEARRVMQGEGWVVAAVESVEQARAAQESGADHILLPAQKAGVADAPVMSRGIGVYACMTFEKSN